MRPELTDSPLWTKIICHSPRVRRTGWVAHESDARIIMPRSAQAIQQAGNSAAFPGHNG